MELVTNLVNVYTVVYTIIAVFWFAFVLRAKNTKNYMLLVSWAVFLPFTFVLFIGGVCWFVFIEDFVCWLKRDF
jgi:hypothetical protein